MSYSNGLLPEKYSKFESYGKGDPGVGFKLTDNGDYDIQNKKLVNVKQGTDNNDVVTKSQVNIKTVLLDGARAGYVTNNKAAIYSGTGSLHAQSLYLKDTPDNAGNSDEIRMMTEYQSYDNVHLYIPNLENYDGYGGRRRSEMMVTSVDQVIDGKRFSEISKSQPQQVLNDDPTPKSYVDSEIAKLPSVDTSTLVKKSGDTMTGDLILQSQPYPVLGNTNKATSYRTIRDIFLSRKEAFPIQTIIDMNNHVVENLGKAKYSHEAVRKDQLSLLL